MNKNTPEFMCMEKHCDEYDMEHLENIYFRVESYNSKYSDPNSFDVSLESIVEEKGIGEEYQPYIQYNSDKKDVWSPENFKLETTTIWSFLNRGNWATHNSKYRGNWSPYIPRNLILRYTEREDVVLDQFLGSGTTLIETKLLGRYGIGVDINNNAIEIAKRNISFRGMDKYEPRIYKGDARNLDFIGDSSVDLICTHPPYSNIIKYSKDIDGDLSHLDISPFIHEMESVANECFRILKSNKYCAILMGDIRRNKHVIPLGFRIMQQFIDSGFALKEIVIKEQHNCRSNSFWSSRSIEYNFLLIAHEYIFIFRKP